VTAQARLLAERWAAAGVAVTLGPRGALLVEGAGAPMVMPAIPAPGGDPCGAGDRFAATTAGLLADGALPSEAIAAAVTAATYFVAAGGATSIHLDPASLAARRQRPANLATHPDPGRVAAGLDPGSLAAPLDPGRVAARPDPGSVAAPLDPGGLAAPEPRVPAPGPPVGEANPSPGGGSSGFPSPSGAPPGREPPPHREPPGREPPPHRGPPGPEPPRHPEPTTHPEPPTHPEPLLVGGSPMERALAVIGAVRAGGGTVVATGGCFDLLHAGHVATLRSARALGDCLVVCLNSDDSVRRLKGLERPLVPEADRVAVLEALGCVDAVVPFDERTPEAVLQRLRPDVFAKGGDYALADLPEAALLATWGGQAVVLPYLEGRSTTQLMKEVVRRDSH
jgi:rfaE bifunctional protein nucleotidyltransferase chain/domain